jgi:diguanylate cyclase (GGDEF)-like protein
MQRRVVNGTLKGGVLPRFGIPHLFVAGRKDAPTPATQSQEAVPYLTELKRALAASKHEAQEARQHIATLAEINSRLEQIVAHLCKKETQARDFAYHDELTGLPNRRLLRDRLNQAMAQGTRQRKQVVLLLLDLDGFKTINDQLGHAAGDKVLQAVAERLRATIRAADTACRYGGDEFVIMLPEVDHMGLANTVTAKVRARLSEPCIIDGYEICLAARVGTVVYPDDGETCEELIRQADSGLYGAKAGSSAASIRALPLAQAGM